MYFPYILILLCLICGFISSHSIAMAAIIFPFHLFLLWLGGWFDSPIGVETMILVAALLFSAVAGTSIGRVVRKRGERAKEEEFVPPPPPPGWSEARRKRLQGDAVDLTGSAVAQPRNERGSNTLH